MGYADNDAQKLAEAQLAIYQIVGLQERIRRLEDLLRYIREVLAVDTAQWEADLINKIDEVIDADSTH